MRVDAFDFDLPAEAVALHPANPRDEARLLVVRPGQDGVALADERVKALPDLLRAGDVLVVNDTRVLPARLVGERRRGTQSARIEATLHKREGEARWRAFVRPAKKLAVGETVRFRSAETEREATSETILEAEVLEKGENGEILFGFPRSGADLDAAIGAIGSMPLPPYIAARRSRSTADDADYQTMFARDPGAVAAPTAGLHFTPELAASLERRGIAIHRVTLHVGAGTFLPVKAEDTADHLMHAEWGEVGADVATALNAARSAGGRIVAVGTTSLRILESAAGVDGTIAPFSGDTSIFITPGYRFRAVDLLMTNFHLPRSTLFMLVAAFSGLPAMRDAYRHAVQTGYRFYSYGDASLLFPATVEESAA